MNTLNSFKRISIRRISRCASVFRLLILIWVAIAVPLASASVTNVWTGNSGTDWHDAGNWSLGTVPGTSTNVLIDGSAAQDVMLSASTSPLGDVKITHRTLTFSNGETKLRGQSITLSAGAVINHTGPYGTTDEHHAVFIECVDFQMDTNAVIHVQGRGYLKGQGPGSAGDNLGSGSPGAGHGGRGGQGATRQRAGGSEYGDPVSPSTPGSGGTSFNASWAGGPGGGIVRINASGAVRIDGLINASGANSPDGYSSGGAGGSIWISCDIWDGNGNGTLQVNGGNGGLTGFTGGGGGGRIALHYNTWSGAQNTYFHTWPGTGINHLVTVGSTRGAYPGTLYFSTDEWLGTVSSNIAGRLLLGNTNIIHRSEFHLSGGLLGISSNLPLVTDGPLEISGNGHLLMEGGSITAAGDVVLTNNACLYLISAATNALPTGYGALLKSEGAFKMSGSSSCFLASHLTDGGAPRVRALNLHLGSDATINAVAKGFDGQIGPGAGADGSDGAGGGGYGVRGGDGRDYRNGGGFTVTAECRHSPEVEAAAITSVGGVDAAGGWSGCKSPTRPIWPATSWQTARRETAIALVVREVQFESKRM